MKKTLPAIYAVAAAAAVSFVSVPAHAEKTMSKSEVQEVVKSYLLEHPEVIVDSMKKYQEKEAQAATKRASEFLTAHKNDVYGSKTSPVAGNPKGDITIVEFFDYHCGYCKKMLPTMSEIIKDDPKIKVVFKEFPILSEDSDMAARAALAFNKLKPGKYFEYHTALMQMSGKFDEAKLIDEAKKLGASEEDMKKEMKSDWVKKELKDNKQLAEKLNVRGTPGFLVGDTLIPGAASKDDILKLVTASRKEAKAGKGRAVSEGEKSANADE